VNLRAAPIRWAAVVGVVIGVLLSTVLVRTGSLRPRVTSPRTVAISDLCVSETAEQRHHRPWCFPPHLGVDPLSLPDDPHAEMLTEHEVIVLARGLGHEPKADPPTHPAYAKRMTLQEWNGLTPSPESPTFDGSRVVWLVTVHAPRRTDGGVLQHAYSSLIDAQTGTEISGCIGCSFLQPDGTLNLRPNS
jgi:hypothetical protein